MICRASIQSLSLNTCHKIFCSKKHCYDQQIVCNKNRQDNEEENLLQRLVEQMKNKIKEWQKLKKKYLKIK